MRTYNVAVIWPTIRPMPDILLTTVNARYTHAALGLRYLHANLGELGPRAAIEEFTLDLRPADMAERLLARAPRIIGVGVYVWNAAESRALVAVLKAVAPEVTVVIGGPEVSHEIEGQEIARLADYCIAGQADLAFADLCRSLLAGERPAARVLHAPPPVLAAVALPYRLYTDEDIAHRTLYVEASRGCPFRCEFCLSALDRTAKPFPRDRFLAEMEALFARGARSFKFVDRTFNLNLDAAAAILEFFLARLDDRVFLHFEVVPDRLPPPLLALIARFPPGALQLEIGVQTFNPEVQQLISRHQDDAATEANLRALRGQTSAHLHSDLILGLPGEDVASIAAGFNRLHALRPHEIQVGLLKRLRGAPVARHGDAFGLRFSPDPPYTVLATDRIDFATMQRLARFARYWDLVANSGRFRHTLPLLLDTDPFARFLAFSDWLFAATGQTHRIALPRLFELIHEHLLTRGVEREGLLSALTADFAPHDSKGCPAFLRERIAGLREAAKERRGPPRQARHL